MNSSRQIHDPATEERASFWAARLDGSVLSVSDQQALETWLAEHPAHRSLLSQYCQFSADLEVLLPALAASGGVDWPHEVTSPRRSRRPLWFASAALAAAAAVVFAVWLGHPRTQLATIATAVAQRQTLELADGSRAELNAQTSLQIELGATERRVRLAGGEAFFTVAKDPARPFIVETPAGSVRVTGTVFNVRAESAGAFEVLVVEGHVQVRPGDSAAGRPVAPVQLGAGDLLSASAGGVAVQTLSAGAMEDALAWRRGQVVFKGVHLSAALARFARYHGRGITASPNVADFSVGGLYSLDDLDGFLGAMEAMYPVRVTRGPNGTVQVGPALKAEPPPVHGIR